MGKDKDKQKYEKYRVNIAKQYKERISNLEEDNSMLRHRINTLNAEIKQLKKENSKLEEQNSLYRMVTEMSEAELAVMKSFAMVNGLFNTTIHPTMEDNNFVSDVMNTISKK